MMDERALHSMASGFCGQLKTFVTCLHSNTSQLRASITHKPPAYADLSSFLLDFNDRLAEDGAQMDLLEDMTVENVSFEELLAHCMELYKQNESSISSLESHLEQFGYCRNVGGGEEAQALDTPFVEGLKQRVRAKESSPKESTKVREDMPGTPNAELLSSLNSSGRSYAHLETIRSSDLRSRGQSNLGSYQSPLATALAQSKLDSDDLSMLCESFSLEDFGISASSLASLAKNDLITPEKVDAPILQKQGVTRAEVLSDHCSDGMDESCGSSPPSSPSHKCSEEATGVKSQSSLQFLDRITVEEHNQLLPWLRQRVPLEELNEIVLKINDAFQIQSETLSSANGERKQLELEASFLLTLGSNMKTALFALVQIDKLIVVCHNSCSYYRTSELAKFRC